MRKSIAFALCLFTFLSSYSLSFAQDVCAQIEDPAFKDYCLNQFDINKDGKLSIEEASQVREIVVADCEIKVLKGIECFKSITSLDCSSNLLTDLDVSKNTALTELFCQNNQLTNLDVSKNTNLENLVCENNKLRSLDVNKNTKLDNLVCGYNNLTSLDVSKNTSLTSLYCEDNNLTDLDVSKNTQLEVLQCGSNKLTSLDLSKNTKLWRLLCDFNNITSLDLSYNLALTDLFCDEDTLMSLNVGNNSALREHEKRVAARVAKKRAEEEREALRIKQEAQSAQSRSSQGTTVEKDHSIDPVGVWKDKAAVIVFTLNRDGSAMVKIYRNGTWPTYRTTWREMDGRYIIGGIEAVSSWILYPNGDLYSLSESGVTRKVDIEIYKAL